MGLTKPQLRAHHSCEMIQYEMFFSDSSGIRGSEVVVVEMPGVYVPPASGFRLVTPLTTLMTSTIYVDNKTEEYSARKIKSTYAPYLVDNHLQLASTITHGSFNVTAKFSAQRVPFRATIPFLYSRFPHKPQIAVSGVPIFA
jgi:hypothetical protein